MSFFVLIPAQRKTDSLSDLITHGMRNGFTTSHDETMGDFRFVAFKDLSGNTPPSATDDNGNSAFCFGSFIYKKKSGLSALEMFLRDFEPHSFDWSETIGHFVIVLSKNGKIYILNDGLGAAKIFMNSSNRIVSNSFVSQLYMNDKPKFHLQGCYEYVFAGSCYGNTTFVEDIVTVDPNSILRLETKNWSVIRKKSPISHRKWSADATLSDVANHHLANLNDVFEAIAGEFGDRIRVSMSGGYDSRLMLASLLRLDVKPRVFSYGDEDDIDVQIAKTVSREFNLEFFHIDKSLVQKPSPDDFAATAERNMFGFDGWKCDAGLMGGNADYRDRLSRHVDGQVPLNGSLGEIYRNFFYLIDRKYSAMDIVSVFFSGYGSDGGGKFFDNARYRATLAGKIAQSIDRPPDVKLDRGDIERIYPSFRGRYWTGHDAQINQRFGGMFFPYLEHAVITDTATTPLRHKNLGVLQGEMIHMQLPRLAEIRSGYGYPMRGKRPLSIRLKNTINNMRPPFVRRQGYRFHVNKMQPRQSTFSDKYLSSVIGNDYHYIDEIFNLNRLYSLSQFDRAVTLEYIGQKFGFESPRRETW